MAPVSRAREYMREGGSGGGGGRGFLFFGGRFAGPLPWVVERGVLSWGVVSGSALPPLSPFPPRSGVEAPKLMNFRTSHRAEIAK